MRDTWPRTVTCQLDMATVRETVTHGKNALASNVPNAVRRDI